MNRSTLTTIAQRLAAMAVIGLALLLQACSCTNLGPSCHPQVDEHGVYLVHYLDVNFTSQETTKETNVGGYLSVCDCLAITGVEKLHVVNDIKIAVSDSPDPVKINEPLTYDIYVLNLGTENATGINVEVTLPASFSVLNAGSLTCAPANGNIVCKNSVPFDLANDDATFVLRVTPTAAGKFVVTAKAFAIEADFNLNNNVDTEETIVNESTELPVADLTVSITAAPNPVRNGSELTYTIDVKNTGPQNATQVVLEGFFFFERLEGRNIRTTAGSCTVTRITDLTCNIGELADGATAAVIIKAFPFETGTLTKSVRVTSNNDPHFQNDNATVQVTVNPP